MARLVNFYPVGIQTFENIREGNYLYVDKTKYVIDFRQKKMKYIFLSRPRRFGKSLFASTLHAYFAGKKELFEGLAIADYEKEWVKHPVLHFDMSGAKHMDKEQLERYLSDMLGDQEAAFGYKSEKIDPNIRLKDLVKKANEQTGQKVVIIIDEYDAPLLDVVHEQENLQPLRQMMQNFYSPVKLLDPYLEFVFITGITKFSQLSIFSELNNITNVSMNETYAGICGITKEELLTQMSDDIDRLAEKLEMSREETIEELKQHYDGYHFAWPSPDVFNPFSLLNCFADGNLDDYWFGSGTPTYLLNMMRKYEFLPSDLGDTAFVGKQDFDAATETMTTIMPLLYQSGYFTIKGYDKEAKLYELALPNREVKVGMFGSLLPHYLERNTAKGNTAIARMSVLVKRGKMDDALQLLADFLETVPYCNDTHYEGHYQQMMYVIFALLTNYDIRVEQHTAKGRIDITLETASCVYVMELKFNKTAQDALDQINAKRYTQAFAMKGKDVVKVGMNFAVKDEVNTLEWVTE